MDLEVSRQPIDPIEFTQEQWVTIKEYLWDLVLEVSEMRAALEIRLQELYETHSRSEGKLLSATERAERKSAEEHYWDTHAQFLELTTHENKILELLEAIDSGNARAEEAAIYLPKEEAAQTEKISKRKAAILEQQKKLNKSQVEINCGAFLLSLYGIEYGQAVSNDFLRTDPRRITSGRNRSRLNAGAGLDTSIAEQAFVDVTADTHGGKSRRPSKNSNYYTSSSGKRIRKR